MSKFGRTSRGGKRRDGNHADLVRQIRKLPGFEVLDVADLSNLGFDLIVYSPKSRRNHLCEVKNPATEWKLEPSEQAMSEDWPRDWCIIEDIEDVLTLR